MKEGVYPLIGKVRHYAWGGFDFIPQLLGIDNGSKKPFAELWLGSHSEHSSEILTPEGIFPLRQFLVNQGLSDLSFMVKVLDVRNMLSIQAHPGSVQAREGFEREERMKIPHNATERVFHDPYPKPEIMVALSPFFLLSGFKDDSRMLYSLKSVPEFNPLVSHYLDTTLKGFYTFLMQLPQIEVNRILKPLGQRIKPLYLEGKLSKDNADYWAAKAFTLFNRKGFCDRGIFSIYLMNLIKLETGQGIFQPPGTLHAYLEGNNLECMRSSDNTLRGGLTEKHIDITELLRALHFKKGNPPVISESPVSRYESEYPMTVTDFHLRIVRPPENTMEIKVKGPEIWIVLKGSIALPDHHWKFNMGNSFIVFSKKSIKIKSLEKESHVFRIY